jgi:NADH-quinone oxidoreductase subunit M
MLPLLLFIFWIGIYPNTFFSKMNPAMEKMLVQMGADPVAVVEMHQPAAVEHSGAHAKPQAAEHGEHKN